jgi:hypothetical protein
MHYNAAAELKPLARQCSAQWGTELATCVRCLLLNRAVRCMRCAACPETKHCSSGLLHSADNSCP